ncbi:MAG: hypothetical protein IRY99_26685, partial [Isosphaeraceae bacterium]|nr:hypothetical protein [Isosphaeraceae bacterium]
DLATLGGASDGSSFLQFLDRHRMRLGLYASSDGSTMLSLVHRDSQSTAGMYLWPDGQSGLLMHRQGQDLKLGMEKDGSARLGFSDRYGQERYGLGVLADGSPTMTVSEAPVLSPASSEPMTPRDERISARAASGVR